jgi:hypothetical protein
MPGTIRKKKESCIPRLLYEYEPEERPMMSMDMMGRPVLNTLIITYQPTGLQTLNH